MFAVVGLAVGRNSHSLRTISALAWTPEHSSNRSRTRRNFLREMEFSYELRRGTVGFDL
jgi:hypothetical protein